MAKNVEKLVEEYRVMRRVIDSGGERLQETVLENIRTNHQYEILTNPLKVYTFGDIHHLKYEKSFRS